MLLFTDTGKLIFRDEKLQVVPEGNAAEDCWCCDPGPQDNCFLCKDPDSDNYNKKFYGGTTTASGFPSTYEHSYSAGFGFVCGSFYTQGYYTVRTTNLTQLNYSWLNEPPSLTDCTKLNGITRRTVHNIIVYISGSSIPCAGTKKLLVVYEIVAIWNLTYGTMWFLGYESSKLVYADPSCGTGGVAWQASPHLKTYTSGGNICDTETQQYPITDICSAPSLITITSVPNFLP